METLSKCIHPEKVIMSMTTQKVFKHLIQLVVDNGIALTMLSSPAFTCSLGEMADKLGVSLQRRSMRNMTLREAHSQKKKCYKNIKVWYILVVLCTRQIHFPVNLRHTMTIENVSVQKRTEARAGAMLWKRELRSRRYVQEMEKLRYQSSFTTAPQLWLWWQNKVSEVTPVMNFSTGLLLIE